MSIPQDILTRTVMIGSALSTISVEDFLIKVVVAPSDDWQWKQTLYKLEQTKLKLISSNGPNLSITLPVTDQDGWINSWDKSIVNPINGATHTYSIKVSVLTATGNKTGIEYSNTSFVVPTGNENLNFDASVSLNQLYEKVFSDPLLIKAVIANSNFNNGHLYPG